MKMIRKTVLILAAFAAIVTAAAIASTQTSAGSYGHSVGGGGYSSSQDLQKPAYSFGTRSHFVY
jgi:hypothetical protein